MSWTILQGGTTARVGVLIVSLIAFVTPTVRAQEPPPANIVVDRDLTTASGVMDVLTIQRALSRLEDRLVPTRFAEATPTEHALGIVYRLGKWVALDLPQDVLLMDIAHEVFGHGSRLRELNVSGIHYGFDLPPPYGSGNAVTSFDAAGLATATRADGLAIDTGGIEAQNVLADDIGQQALTTGTWSYRQAWLYAQSRIAGLLYIQGVSAHPEPGNDVADFLHDFNAGCQPPTCSMLTASTLKHRALFMLADPALATAAYAFAVSYVVQGQPTAAMPMISLPSGLRYLPTAGFAMTPYGTEWTTDQNFVANGHLTRVTLRVGDAGATRPWGASVLLARIAALGPVTADVSADLWRQPPLDASPSAIALKTGGLVAATAHAALGHRSASSRVGVIGQFGYKSVGFAPGEPLRAGAVVRAGLTVALD